MTPININRKTLSELVWKQIEGRGRGLGELFRKLDELRDEADYNTGSLDERDVQDLQDVVFHFRPAVVAEVGTFIGRSTMAIAHSMDEGGTIYTCDVSNDIKLPEVTGGTIVQYPKKSSTDMFEDLLKQKVKVDLFYIDGRLSPKDIRLILELMHNKTVFVLDDFEGVEKGVGNAMLLMQYLTGYALIYPRHTGKTAILIPGTLLQFTAQ
jgi:predicted O-methyltransferase YrrM